MARPDEASDGLQVPRQLLLQLHSITKEVDRIPGIHQVNACQETAAQDSVCADIPCLTHSYVRVVPRSRRPGELKVAVVRCLS